MFDIELESDVDVITEKTGAESAEKAIEEVQRTQVSNLEETVNPTPEEEVIASNTQMEADFTEMEEYDTTHNTSEGVVREYE